MSGSTAAVDGNSPPWWNNPHAFPERRLYLDLLAPRMEDEEELSYKFSLLPEKEAEDRNRRTPTNTGTAWETSSTLRMPRT